MDPMSKKRSCARELLFAGMVLSAAISATGFVIGAIAGVYDFEAKGRKEQLGGLIARVNEECGTLGALGARNRDSAGHYYEITGCMLKHSEFVWNEGMLVLDIQARSRRLRGIEREISYYYGCGEYVSGNARRGSPGMFSGKGMLGVCMGMEKRSWQKKRVIDREIPLKRKGLMGNGIRNSQKRPGLRAPGKFLRASKR